MDMTCRQSSATSYSMTVHVFQSRAFERPSCLRAEKNCCVRSTFRSGSKLTTSVCGHPSGSPRLYISTFTRSTRLYAELSHQQQLATDANEASSSTSECEIDVETLVSAAKTAAEAGAHVVHQALDKPKNISFKGVTDLVTDTDKASEEAVLSSLKGRFPDHCFLGEEGGTSGNPSSRYLWAVDPLDGTTNFSHAYPSFGVSVAVVVDGQPIAACVVEFTGGPHAWTTKTYTAGRGQGAFCNGRQISASDTDDLTRSLLVTGFGYEHDEPWAANIELFKYFTDKTQGVRRLGAAAIDLCHVALGVSDGFWEYRLKPWDMAAGVLMVKEAGGVVTDMEGGPFSVFSRTILATNGHLHPSILEQTDAKTKALRKNDVDFDPWFIPSGYKFKEE